MNQSPSHDFYQKRAKEGYGLMYPDGHVIRGWELFLKNQFPNPSQPGRMLDFGCSNGTHALYFREKGFDVAGVDIIPSYIELAKERLSDCKDLFYTIDDKMSLTGLFPEKFDLIFSNQTLYFLNSDTFNRRLIEFDQLLENGGHVFFTMMARENCFSEHSIGVRPDGLEEIRFSAPHRLEGKTAFVRFIESAEHLKAVFCRFECLTVGFYDVAMNERDCGRHYIFIGKKRAT